MPYENDDDWSVFEPEVWGKVKSWDSQARQYPSTGEPGISYFKGKHRLGIIHCLLYYVEDGTLAGILNYYPHDFPPYETQHAINLWVRPDQQRKGIATMLAEECRSRWVLEAKYHRYTPDSGAMAKTVREKRLAREAAEDA